MKAETFDRKFESGAGVIADLDLARASRPQLAQKRVNVDFPDWMIDRLDKEARRLGVTRQSVIPGLPAQRAEAGICSWCPIRPPARS